MNQDRWQTCIGSDGYGVQDEKRSGLGIATDRKGGKPNDVIVDGGLFDGAADAIVKAHNGGLPVAVDNIKSPADPDRERDIEHVGNRIAWATNILTADHLAPDDVAPLELRALRAVQVLAKAHAEFLRLFPPKERPST